MTDAKDPPVLLTVAEVAALLRTTEGAVYARVERGKAPAGLFRDGRRIRFVRADLLAWVASKTQKPKR